MRMPSFSRRAGSLLLGVWLILTGAGTLFGLTFQGFGTLLAVIAIIAGVLIIMDR